MISFPYIFRLVHCERIHSCLLHFLCAMKAERRMAGLYTNSTATMSTLRHRNSFLRCIHFFVPLNCLNSMSEYLIFVTCKSKYSVQKRYTDLHTSARATVRSLSTHSEQWFTDFNIRKNNLVCLLKMPLRPHLGTNQDPWQKFCFTGSAAT